VDLADRTLRVGRSNDADTTKGGHEDLLPIPDELAPWLEAAVQVSRSELVFPAEDGEQRDPGTKLQHVLRRALGRAGIVTGYVHKCRRKGCVFEEQLPHPDAGRCPKCDMRLWPKALPKKLRFHDLRHSNGDAAPEGRRPTRDGAADPSPHGPAHHRRNLRPPRPGRHARGAHEAHARALRPAASRASALRAVRARAVAERGAGTGPVGSEIPNNDAAFRVSGRQDLKAKG
jgi:hypothetical protein